MADKKSESSPHEPSTQQVVELLNAILDEFRKQARSGALSPLESDAIQTRSTTLPPLEDDALTAIYAFREITEALNVEPAKSALKGS